MKTTISRGLLALTFLVAASTSAVAASVARVVTVQTDDVAAYVQQIEKGKAIIEKAGDPPKIRVWRATYAGPNTGTVIVSVEYASMADLAANTAKLADNAEFATWLKGLDKLRKIVSDSIYEEQ
jgi:hypothetical protein